MILAASAPRTTNTAPKGYVSAAPQAATLIRIFAVGIALDLLAVGSGLADLLWLEDVVGDSWLFDFNDVLLRLIVLLQLVVLLVLLVMFIRWMVRVVENIRPLRGSKPRFGRGWAIAAWFVPFACIVLPPLVLRQAWSGGEYPRGRIRWMGPMALLWWAALLVDHLLLACSSGLYVEAITLEEYVEAARWTLVADVVSIGTTLLAIATVRRVTGLQVDRAALLDQPVLN